MPMTPSARPAISTPPSPQLTWPSHPQIVSITAANLDFITFWSALMESETDEFYARIVATLFIFVVSLLAASFPTLSKRISFLRIPRIIFFIGKHFGTGVILSTAFVHLLQDSFVALRSPEVLARWNLGKHVGLIVLCSLLAIFLVEYVSTSYVDRLQSCSSPTQPSPVLPTPRDDTSADLECPPPLPKIITIVDRSDPEQTPLLREINSHCPPNHAHNGPEPSYGAVHHRIHTHESVGGVASTFFDGHHRHEVRDLHEAHHERSRPVTMYGPGVFAPCLPTGAGHVNHSESPHNHHHHGVEDVTNTHGHHHSHGHHHHDHDGHEDKTSGNKQTQIVGILVLQLGIMIHSLVIGLTLSITSGPDFTSLLIAVIFHQLFEGLSLGIRISSLPSPREDKFTYLNILKPVLACLFAITAPAGILLGMLVFEFDDDMAHVRLTQGIMSAVSAGMLTYAACVEMLAGDFVMDPLLWRSSVRRQALALFSLLAGVAAMALVGS